MQELNSIEPSSLRHKSDNEEEEKIDTISNRSSTSDIEELNGYNGAVVSQEDNIGLNQDAPCFGNVSVMNSNDVHFGNKTVYQGPVTIKQFLYNNGRLYENDQKQLDADSASNRNVELDVKNLTNSFINKGFAPDSNEDSAFNNKNGDISNNCVNKLPESAQSIDWWSKLKKRKLLVISTTTLLLFSIIIILIFTLKNESLLSSSSNSGYDSEGEHNTPIEYNSDKLKIVTRDIWEARPKKENLTLLQTPVPLVIIMHTATEQCTSQSNCILSAQNIQNFHMDSRNWSDVAYNFMVGGDGAVYEGRGWLFVGANVFGYNTKCIGIALIGTFINILPPKWQLEACQKLIEEGVRLNFIQKDYKLVGARQLSPTESPGFMLYNEIKTWSHWSKTP